MDGILLQASFVAAAYAALFVAEAAWIRKKPVSTREVVKTTIVAYTAAACGIWAAGSLRGAGGKRGGAPGAFVGKPGF